MGKSIRSHGKVVTCHGEELFFPIGLTHEEYADGGGIFRLTRKKQSWCFVYNTEDRDFLRAYEEALRQKEIISKTPL